MPDIFKAIALGIVQGLTEFFPVSSSGHLVIMQSLFGLESSQVAFDVFLHAGTLVSILIFFRHEIFKLSKDIAMLGWVILGTLPAAVVGILFKHTIEGMFANPRFVGYMFIVTGIWLLAASVYSAHVKKAGHKKRVGAENALIIGLGQLFSLMPGVSRSGSTIATGILTGLDKEAAFRFSFLLAIPAIGGATIFKAHDITAQMISGDFVYFMAGAITAMLVGIFAIKTLLNILRNNRLYIFSIYCLLAGGVTILLFR